MPESPITSLLVDLTLATPGENLALDEALLEEEERRIAEGRDSAPTGVLRFWESAEHFLVVGASGRIREEARLDACERDGIPVLRRASGGGTVLQGPGCLNFALVLPIRADPALRDVKRSHAFFLERTARAIGIEGLSLRGTSDLAVGDRKVSGSAQKRTRHVVLHHGTIIHGLDAALVARWLREPLRQPEYRRGRSHEAFVTKLPILPAEIKDRMCRAWGARPAPPGWRPPPLGRLLDEKYANPAWIARF